VSENGSGARAAKLVAQLTAAAGAHLPPGETVHLAVRVNLSGTVAATAAGAVGGALGAVAAASATESGAESAAAAGFPTARQQAIGVTDTHLVVCSRGGLSGRPKAFLALVPLEALVGVEHVAGRLGDQLTFTMRSGAATTFECVKVDPGAELAEAITNRLG
jgi:hypothetical protein